MKEYDNLLFIFSLCNIFLGIVLYSDFKFMNIFIGFTGIMIHYYDFYEKTKINKRTI